MYDSVFLLLHLIFLVSLPVVSCLLLVEATMKQLCTVSLYYQIGLPYCLLSQVTMLALRISFGAGRSTTNKAIALTATNYKYWAQDDTDNIVVVTSNLLPTHLFIDFVTFICWLYLTNRPLKYKYKKQHFIWTAGPLTKSFYSNWSPAIDTCWADNPSTQMFKWGLTSQSCTLCAACFSSFFILQYWLTSFRCVVTW